MLYHPDLKTDPMIKAVDLEKYYVKVFLEAKRASGKFHCLATAHFYWLFSGGDSTCLLVVGHIHVLTCSFAY